MNELLQRHGCSTVFSIPEGLKELMSDISREVIREQPANILEFITKYLSALIITREHGLMAVQVLNELCDCRPSLSEHLMQLGLSDDKAKDLANIISEEIEGFVPDDEKDKIKESKILGRILQKVKLDEETAAQICEITRNAYRDYWYRKNEMREKLKPSPTLPWEVAARNTLANYKTTKPTMEEMNQAAVKIQAAYKGYHVRKNLLQQQKTSPMIYTLPPVETSGSRTIEFGPIVNIKVQEDNIEALFAEEYETGKKVCLCTPDDKENIHNTPADALMSRRSDSPSKTQTQELHGSESPKCLEDPGAMAFGRQNEWKEFYLQATKKANKDREELKMSAPIGVVADVTVEVDNFSEDEGRTSCNLHSEENKQRDSDVHDTA